MDRFCGSLILTGGLSQVQTAVEEVVRFFDQELGFKKVKIKDEIDEEDFSYGKKRSR